jgi:hypothetical protein
MSKLFRCALAAGVLGISMASAVLAAERSLSSEVKLEPMAKAGVYKATVEIRDASSNELLAAPTIAFMKGGPNTTTTTLETGEEVRFTVQVDASGAGASYTAELRSGGKLVSLQKATIALAQ